LLRLLRQAGKRIATAGGDFTRYCYVESADPLFGPPMLSVDARSSSTIGHRHAENEFLRFALHESLDERTGLPALLVLLLPQTSAHWPKLPAIVTSGAFAGSPWVLVGADGFATEPAGEGLPPAWATACPPAMA